MERSKTRADVAVFIDFENVYVSVREKFDATPNFELIMDRCEDYGRIVIARAYADWYRYPRVTSALFANGVEPMYVPTYYYDREVGRTGRPIKNSVDIHLCIDAMRTLYTQTHIDKFVLVTGDRDFIPLVNAIRQHGKEVIIIGIGGAASAHLAQSGDEFLFYEQIADLKTPQQQRQEQQVPRTERRERDRPEKVERGERERVEANGRVDGKRERPEKIEREKAPTPAEAQPVSEAIAPEAIAPEAAAPEPNYFGTLVDAINLARQRGFVSNLGSLKVLMRELDSTFNESKVKDAHGKPFSKFKDFVKEAERQARVQIFTNGTVTEVFLPGEDPLRVSQFAEELASQQVERELEHELAEEEARLTSGSVEPEIEQPEVEQPEVEQPALPTLEEAVGEVTVPPAQPQVAEKAPREPAELEPDRPVFGEREWQIFRGSMSQFTDPVRFAEIFSALRGLRNQEVFVLTNNELKELVKQAINKGMLQRTGRGARAYYRLSSQYRVPQDELRVEAEQAAAELATTSKDAAVEESAAGLVSDTGIAPAVRQRRGRAYDTRTTTEAGPEVAATSQPIGTENTPVADVVSEEMAVQTAIEPAPAKPRRNRRKKTSAPAETAATPTEVEASPEPALQAEAEASSADTDGAQASANGPKKRRSRRKKATTRTDEGESEPTSGAEE